jgi:serine/threonine protein kinase
MAPAPLRAGDPARIGRYRLSARLGAGGMGVVYLGTARDGTLAAVKVLRAELADDAEFRARFRREVAALERVSGICTVRVIEADTESGRPFLTTEYAAGPTLAEHVRDFGPLAEPMLCGLAAGLAEALTAIHAAGIVHRDLKPGNVLLTRDGPKVIDFGIAQALDFTSVTRTGLSVGSPGFMAPEQVRGQAGQPADVFAWALTVAYAASGQPPFGAGTAEAIFYRILHDDPDTEAVPGALRPLVAEALAKDPAERPGAADLLRRLAAATGDSEAPAGQRARLVLARTWLSPPVSQPPPTMAGRRRRRLIPAAALMLALAATGSGLTLAGLRSNAAQPAAPLAPAPSGYPATTWVPGRPSPQPLWTTPVTPSGPVMATNLPTTWSPPAPPPATMSWWELIPSRVSGDIAQRGYAPTAQGPAWDSSATLNAVVATPHGPANGGMRVFFYAGLIRVGDDTPDGSGSLTISRVSDTKFVVRYAIYNPGDQACCPYGGTADVGFTWTGSRLVALRPVPSPASRNAG